jgi:protease I
MAAVAGASPAERLAAFEGETLVPRLSTLQLLNGGGPQNETLKRFLLSAPANPSQLAGKRIAVVSADGVEEIEILAPIVSLRERGATVDLVAPRYQPLSPTLGVQYPEQRKTHILTTGFMENRSWVKIDRFLDQVHAEDYDAILIPGGAWNPDTLRTVPEALSLVRQMNAQGKVVAAICHGPLVLASAGILKGRKATSYWSVQLDIQNAGATVSDVPVVVDGNLITSRFPYDIPQLIEAIGQALTAK